MQRNVGNLIAVGLVIRIRAVQRPLITVPEGEIAAPIPRLIAARGLHIPAQHLDPPDVEHRPTELGRGRNGDDFVPHAVEIGRQAQGGRPRAGPELKIQVQAQLHRAFRPQVRIPDQGVIQIIEGRKPVTQLGEYIHFQPFQRPIEGGQRGHPGLAESVFPGPRPGIFGIVSIPGALVDQVGGQVRFFPMEASGQGRDGAHPLRMNEGGDIGIQFIVLGIGGKIKRPKVQQRPGIGPGEIGRLLAVMEVVIERHRVLLRMRRVMSVVVGIFETKGASIAGAPFLRPSSLNKDILVGLPFGTEGETHRPTDDRTGKTALGTVTIEAYVPLPAPDAAVERRFNAQTLEVAVFPHQGRIKIGKGITAVGLRVVRTQPKHQRSATHPPKAGNRVGGIIRAASHGTTSAPESFVPPYIGMNGPEPAPAQPRRSLTAVRQVRDAAVQV